MPDTATYPQPTPLEAHPDYEPVSAAELRDLNERLNACLKLRTFAIGMKQFKTLEEMNQVQGLRRPKEGRMHTMCQLVTQSRMAGFTLGITAENVRPNSNCGGVHGIDMPDEGTLDGTHMTGVWFENQEAAAAHQAHVRATVRRRRCVCARFERANQASGFDRYFRRARRHAAAPVAAPGDYRTEVRRQGAG